MLLLRWLVGASADNFELLKRYWDLFIAPRREVLHDLVRPGFPPGTDVSLVVDMVAGALFYRVLFRPEEDTAEDLEDYLLAALRQAGHRD